MQVPSQMVPLNRERLSKSLRRPCCTDISNRASLSLYMEVLLSPGTKPQPARSLGKGHPVPPPHLYPCTLVQDSALDSQSRQGPRGSAHPRRWGPWDKAEENLGQLQVWFLHGSLGNTGEDGSDWRSCQRHWRAGSPTLWETHHKCPKVPSDHPTLDQHP